MNPRIEENLEAYLSGSLDAAGLSDFRRALSGADAETRQLVTRMERQSRLIQTALRPAAPPSAAEPVELGAGFYARVLERIEAQRAASPFWAAFLEPLFFRRLVMASATLILLLSVALFTGGPDDMAIAADAPQMIMAGDPEPLVVNTVTNGAPEGRDVVLGDLTTYQE